MVKIKICGFTDATDVKVACDLGVDMVGAIMIKGSPRCLTVKQAEQILAAAPDNVAKVAVVKPRSLEELKSLDQLLKPDFLQIHLIFSPSELVRAHKKLGGGLILVVPVPPESKNHQAVVDSAVRAAEVADIVLLDTKGPAGGGTGLTHDWSISRDVKDVVNKPMFLAGGLNPYNVAEAIRMVKPDGVDVATGVESKPGKKDPKLMRDFIRAARIT